RCRHSPRLGAKRGAMMSAQSPGKELSSRVSRTWCAHALGFLGANLSVGALFCWALPSLIAFWRRPAPRGDWSMAHLLQPWGDPEGSLTALSLVYDVLALGAFVAGLMLIARGARMLADCAGD